MAKRTLTTVAGLWVFGSLTKARNTPDDSLSLSPDPTYDTWVPPIDHSGQVLTPEAQKRSHKQFLNSSTHRLPTCTEPAQQQSGSSPQLGVWVSFPLQELPVSSLSPAMCVPCRPPFLLTVDPLLIRQSVRNTVFLLPFSGPGCYLPVYYPPQPPL